MLKLPKRIKESQNLWGGVNYLKVLFWICRWIWGHEAQVPPTFQHHFRHQRALWDLFDRLTALMGLPFYSAFLWDILTQVIISHWGLLAGCMWKLRISQEERSCQNAKNKKQASKWGKTRSPSPSPARVFLEFKCTFRWKAVPNTF